MAEQAAPLISFLFNIGGNTEKKDILGLCVRVVAKTKEEALARLNNALDVLQSTHGIAVFDDVTENPDNRPGPGIEYIRLFVYPENISTANLSDGDENDFEDPPESVGL